ncbi:hypothetical protein AHF37_07163 [Paragonimus kellicotti]|nr:hypothetical protein AHF37_07163 [Paragonimus kellicotti]
MAKLSSKALIKILWLSVVGITIWFIGKKMAICFRDLNMVKRSHVPDSVCHVVYLHSNHMFV